MKIDALLSENKSIDLIRLIARTAKECGLASYIVGGFVRDLLLNRAVSDFDIVIAGDAIFVGKKLQTAYGGKLAVHASFGTAKWVLPTEVTGLSDSRGEIDLISARKETYPQPASLPVVSFSDMKDDLFRRDFTINTLAMRLDEPHFGELLDLYGGQKDLEAGLIRTLHERSFEDDPTRIFRGIRFEQRFGFRFDEDTLAQINRYRDRIRDLTGSRIVHEFELIFTEDHPEKSMERLDELDLLKIIHPSLKWTAGDSELFRAIPHGSPAEYYFAAWLSSLSSQTISEVGERLLLGKRVLRIITDYAFLRKEFRAADQSEAPDQLDGRAEDALRLFCITEKNAVVRDYLDRGRYIRPELDGQEIIQLGTPAGPAVAEMLKQLRIRRITGELQNRDDEIAFVRRHIGEAK